MPPLNIARDTWATLSFKGASLDPDEITRILMAEPTRANRAGDPSRAGRPIKTGNWALRCPLDSLDLNEHLAWLLQVVGPETVSRIERAGAEYMWMDCVWQSRGSQGGPLIEPAVLQAMGEANLQLFIDFWRDEDAPVDEGTT